MLPGRELHHAGDGLLSAMAPGDRGAPYDRQAAIYDGLVGNALYNRVLWGASIASYAASAASAVTAAAGPLLDVGCGSAVFTAPAYLAAERPLVLLDRSLGMLARAAKRLHGHDPAAIRPGSASFRPVCLTFLFALARSRPWPATACCTCSMTPPRCCAS